MSAIVYKSPQAAALVEAQYRSVLDQWPVPRIEHRLKTHVGDTFVVESGPQDAPPVVLLHGSQANSAAWMLDIEPWARHFRLYAIDMIGEPGFSAPVRPDLTTETHALWLDEVFAALGLPHAALVGTSLGGWLALDYARRRPGFVDALALICPAGIGRQKNFLLKALPLLLLGPWGARKFRELIFGPPPAVVPPMLQVFGPLMETIGRSVNVRTIKIPALTDAHLASLTIPILAIVGGRDALLDSRDTRDRVEANAPQAEVVFLENGYHYLPDQTDRVATFLRRTLGRG